MTKNLSDSLAKKSDIHLLRKIWHMGIGVLGVIVYYSSSYPNQFWVQSLLIFSILSFGTEILRIKFYSINQAVLSVMGPFMRESERESFSGLPFYALGVGFALAFYSQQIATLAVLFLIFSDPISSYVGVKFGKTKLKPNKSLEGSLAGWFVCSVLSLLYIYFLGKQQDLSLQLFLFSFLAGFIGSLSEFLSQKVDDNLTIPVISGLGLTILNRIFQLI